MNDESFKRLPLHLKRRLYAAIKETKNMVSITDIKGSDIPKISTCLHTRFHVRICHYVDVGMAIRVGLQEMRTIDLVCFGSRTYTT